MNRLPWEKFTTRVTPKMTVSPAATRNSDDAPERPVRNSMRKASNRFVALLFPPIEGGGVMRRSPRTQLAHEVVVGQRGGAADVAPVDHRTLAALQRGAPDIGAERALVVDRPPHRLPERRVEGGARSEER